MSRIVKRVLCVLTFGASLIACTKSDIEYVNNSSNKRLRKIDDSTLYYDNQNRLSSVYRTDGVDYTYLYEQNNIFIKVDNEVLYECRLNDGLIVEIYYEGYREERYSYDDKRQLIQRIDRNGIKHNYEWYNGNLVKEYCEYYTRTYEYTDIPSSLGISYFDDILLDICNDVWAIPLLANSGEYFGVHPQYLMSNYDGYQISWSFHDNGYVSAVSSALEDDVHWYLKWEKLAISF
ncbi:MAG: hypothetical protein IJY36_08050 [Coprobacter sp.]|nr:hypothetical protein [Coprobacter sp.]